MWEAWDGIFTSFGKLEFNSQKSLFSYEEIKRNPFTQSTNPKTKTKSIHDINENGQVFCKRSITNQPFFPSLFAKWQSILFLIPQEEREKKKEKENLSHLCKTLCIKSYIILPLSSPFRIYAKVITSVVFQYYFHTWEIHFQKVIYFSQHVRLLYCTS